MFIESVLLSNHLIFYCPFSSFAFIFPNINIFSSELALRLTWPKCWSFLWTFSGEGNGTPTPVLLPGKSHGQRSLVGCSPSCREESDMTERLHFHALEKEMAAHPSVLAWRIPGMGEPTELPSMGSHRVGHDWGDLAAAAAWTFRVDFL